MRLKRLALTTAIVGALAMASPMISTASAHAIIRLNGVSAVAGATSPMTLEIQHGCLPSEPTVQVEAFVGAPWRALTPQPVDDWTSTVVRQPSGGWHVTWVKQGDPVPFGTPTHFPITVKWPMNSGTYGMSVLQVCSDGSTYYWNDKYTPATATADSPPLTPRPEVLVLAKGGSSSSKTPKPSSSATTTAHMH
jgi:uncharacterized protein YcnI